MIICSHTATAEGNFALMNVDTPSFVKSDCQTAENEGETFKFESSKHQPLSNGTISTEPEKKCFSLINCTNGDGTLNFSTNQPKSTTDQNGASKAPTEDISSSAPLCTALGKNYSQSSDKAEDLASSSTQHDGDCNSLEFFKTSLNSKNEPEDLKECADFSLSRPGHNDTKDICTSPSTMINTEPSSNSILDSSMSKIAHNVPNDLLNLGDVSDSLVPSALGGSVDKLSPSSDRSIEVTTPASQQASDDFSAINISSNGLESDQVNPESLIDITNELLSRSRHSNGDINELTCTSELENALETHVRNLMAPEIHQDKISAETLVLNSTPSRKVESDRKIAEAEVVSEKPPEEAIIEVHSMNIQDYANLKVECSHYKSENEQLQHQLSILEGELNSFKAQQSQLLSTIEQQEKQLKQINENAKRQQEIDAKSYEVFKQELESQNEKLKKEWESMKHERELSVMKYAKSEMDVIKLREKSETCQKKLQEVMKERDNAQANMKQLISDKAKYSQMYDNKCSEFRVAHNEIEQLKSDLNSNNNKLKKTQNKLKEEQESHKETQSKLDEVTSTIDAARKEAEQAKSDAQASIKKFKVSQENRAFVLEQQLKEEQAKLILSRAEKEDLDKKIQQLTSKLQQAETEAKTLSETNKRLSDQLQSIEKEKLEMEVKLSTMQQLMNKEVQENVQLESQLTEMGNLRQELEEAKKKLDTLETEAMKLRSSNAELLIDMDSCRKREADMLEFTERLTAQNVKLQSEFSALQAKNEELEMEQSKVDDLKSELEREKSQRLEENKILTQHVAEHTERCEVLSKQLAEEKSENVVLRRKNAATIRELTRELQQMKKQIAEHNNGAGSGSNSLCQDSRTSSCASLTDTSQALSSNPGSIRVEPDKQTLIERIVELQRRNAQYLDRIEFLEEHNQEMTEELKKKTKIVQNFMLREPVGALSSNSMDSNKMALSKKGYMASLYSTKIKDKNMTLEKSLEICQTLHSLLEDTILKNITLKENMDTLGEEIARLRSERMKEGKS